MVDSARRGSKMGSRRGSATSIVNNAFSSTVLVMPANAAAATNTGNVASSASRRSRRFLDRMSTVLVVNMQGLDMSNPQQQQTIDNQVERYVQNIITKVRASHGKFEDPDFGPTGDDVCGAVSLYGDGIPNPVGSKYPPASSLRWMRPLYADCDDDEVREEVEGGNTTNDGDTNESECDEESEEFVDEFDDDFLPKFDEDEDLDKLFCDEGELYISGSSSGDVVQGTLGDCWFLSAMAVVGSTDGILEKCFWRGDRYKSLGLYVVRFFKDSSQVFVIIDDQLPVKASDGQLIFARARNRNELWVPLMEKAYAKLHGCYKSLIGGYTDAGLYDLTGYPPLSFTFKSPSKYKDEVSRKRNEDELWQLLTRFTSWKSLMGCSIQPDTSSKNTVEADAGNGLFFRHAYSLLDCREIQLEDGKTERLVKLRNPWGHMEWTGPFGDGTEERKKYNAQINSAFHGVDVKLAEYVEDDARDGVFFMTFSDWQNRFNKLFAGLRFPDTWHSKRVVGEWTADHGGHRNLGTWITNPRFHLNLPGKSGTYVNAFVGLYNFDLRLSLGQEYYSDPLYTTRISFDIVDEKGVNVAEPEQRKFITGSLHEFELNPELVNTSGKEKGEVEQPDYQYGSVFLELRLEANKDYYIVPSMYSRCEDLRDFPGNFYVVVAADSTADFQLVSGSRVVSELQKPMTVGSGEALTTLTMTTVQFYEKKEALRARIVSEARRLNFTEDHFRRIFNDVVSGQTTKLSRSTFKRRMMESGFMLTDFPDDDLVVLDLDNDGSISPQEFLAFYSCGEDIAHRESISTPPVVPVDDLLFKTSDLEGELSLTVKTARNLRDLSSWFGSARDNQVGDISASSDNIDSKSHIFGTYDPVEARKQGKKLFSELLLTHTTKFLERHSEKVTLETGDKVHEKISNPSTRLNSPRVAEGSVVSRHDMSHVTQRVVEDAARRIHSSDSLKRSETVRADKLRRLRQSVSANVSSNTTEIIPVPTNSRVRAVDSSVLSRRSNSRGRRDRCDISSDYLVAHWLAYNAPSASLFEPLFEENKKPVSPTELDEGENKLKVISTVTSAAVIPTEKAVKTWSGPDFWDLLIDRVHTVATARAKLIPSTRMSVMKSFFNLGSKPISSSQFGAFDSARSVIPEPTAATATQRSARGNISVSRNMLRASGTASTSNAQRPPGSTGRLVHDVNERLMSLHEGSSTRFDEVYSRLLTIPTVMNAEMCGDRLAIPSTDPIARFTSVLASYDKVGSGLLTAVEFTRALADMEIFLSTDEINLLILRFQHRDSRQAKGNLTLDWRLFLEFYRSLHFDESDSAYLILGKLREVREVVLRTLYIMQHYNCSTLEQFLSYRTKSPDVVQSIYQIYADKPPLDLFTIPDTAIFHSLSPSDQTRNMATLQSLGVVNLTSSMYMRIVRIFNFNLQSFMNSVRSMTLSQISSPDSTGFRQALVEVERRLISQLALRTEISNSRLTSIQLPPIPDGPVTTSLEDSLKLWQSLLPGAQDMISYEKMVQFFMRLLNENLIVESSSVKSAASKDSKAALLEDNNSLMPDPTQTLRLNDSSSEEIQLGRKKSVSDDNNNLGVLLNSINFSGVSADVAIRLMVDLIATSRWNMTNDGEESTRDVSATLSVTAMDAFLRRNEIDLLIRKLRYVSIVENGAAQSSINLLVRVFFSSPGDEAVIMTCDPITGHTLKLTLAGESHLSNFPRGSAVAALLPSLYEDRPNMKSQIESIASTSSLAMLYNPWQTPVEDSLVSDVVNRLRIVCLSDGRRELRLTEDPRFVERLKVLLDSHAHNLPFFVHVDDFYVSFEVDDNVFSSSNPSSSAVVPIDKNAVADGRNRSLTVRNYVFSQLRKHRRLYNFLTQVRSSLSVVLSAYNSAYRETFRWTELLAHLSNGRNPYVVVQLLPRYIPPEKYLYNQPSDQADVLTVEEDEDENEEEDDSQDGENDLPALPKRMTTQEGSVDYDGAPFPRWEDTFKFTFRAPRMLSCRVVITEVVSLFIQNKLHYLMIIVREAVRNLSTEELAIKQAKSTTPVSPTQKFWFLTAYDPRSATEFQCGLSAKSLDGNKCSPLYELLYRQQFSGDIPDVFYDRSQLNLYCIKAVQNSITEAADRREFVLGPAITPRVEFSVYNDRDHKIKELVGRTQVPISSVLSSSGIAEDMWAPLNYSIDRSAVTTISSTKDLVPGNANRKGLMDIKAGELQISMTFKSRMQVAAENNAAENARARRTSVTAGMIANSTKAFNATTTFTTQTKDKTKSTKEIQSELMDSLSTLHADLASSKDELLAARNRIEELEAMLLKEKTATSTANKACDEQVKVNKSLDQQVTRLNSEISSLRKELTDSLSKVAPPNLMDKLLVLTETNHAMEATISTMQSENENLQSRIAEFEAAAAETARMTITLDPSDGGVLLNNPTTRHDLLDIFARRVQRKMKILGVAATQMSATMALEGLSRLLTSYGTPEGNITARELLLVLNELMIQVTTEFAVSLLAPIGPNSLGQVKVHSLIESLKSELEFLIREYRKRNTGRNMLGTQDFDGFGTTGELDVSMRSDTMSTPHRPTAPRTGTAPRQNSPPPQRVGRTMRSKSSSNVTSSPRGMEGGVSLTYDELASPSPSPQRPSSAVKKVDVSSAEVPLPEGWELLEYTSRNRLKRVYVNHLTKTTQSTHPVTGEPLSTTIPSTKGNKKAATVSFKSNDRSRTTSTKLNLTADMTEREGDFFNK